MKQYKTLLFDVDDTLLDFQAVQKEALAALFREHAIDYTVEIEQHYDKQNQAMWIKYENGEMTLQELLDTRFQVIFKQLGIDVDGVLMEAMYRQYLNEGHVLMEGAKETLLELHKEYNLYVVTNGVAKTQYKRLRDAGIIDLFQGIFISEEIGSQKPKKAYFDYVFERIPQFSKERTLLIGNSLSSDIKGGNTVGIDTCWVNTTNSIVVDGIEPTYEITSLFDLRSILEKSQEAREMFA